MFVTSFRYATFMVYAVIIFRIFWGKGRVAQLLMIHGGFNMTSIKNFDKKIQFQNLKTFNDIAVMLNITSGFLKKILIDNKLKNYKEFQIPKKNGQFRTIHKPSKNLMIIQSKFKEVLSVSFTPHVKAHGFVAEKDFLTNATQHVKKRYILNIDIEDFFHNITFRRIRHMFLAYFKFNNIVASTLANICCHPDGFLPQGAPTSPIISNLISKSLDKELTHLAKRIGLTHYSRYADDITFSTYNIEFPKQLAFKNSEGVIELSEGLIQIFQLQGFSINSSKTRLQSNKVRQEVTGITVNQKLNINRRYIKNVRAMLHSIESDDKFPSTSLAEFTKKYNLKLSKTKNTNKMFNIIRGKITHIGFVKGTSNDVYINLAKRFNLIVEEKGIKVTALKIPRSKKEMYTKNTFIIVPSKNANGKDNDAVCFKDGAMEMVGYGQGTGFYLKDIGLITNFHVVEFIIEYLQEGYVYNKDFYIEYHSSNLTESSRFAKIGYYNKEKDIAILIPEKNHYITDGFSFNCNLYDNSSLSLIGFPEHEHGTDIRLEEGKLSRVRNTKNQKRYEITPTVFAGNSGGPVINSHDEVIGVAVRGATEKGIVPSEIIPISNIIDLYNTSSN